MSAFFSSSVRTSLTGKPRVLKVASALSAADAHTPALLNTLSSPACLNLLNHGVGMCGFLLAEQFRAPARRPVGCNGCATLRVAARYLDLDPRPPRIGDSKGRIALDPYQPSARRLYRPAALR